MRTTTLLVAAALLATACKKSTPPAAAADTPPPAAAVTDESADPTGEAMPALTPAPQLASLVGTTWTLVTFADAPVEPVGAQVTLSFEEQSLGGHSACNRYGGPIGLDDAGDLTLGPVVSTRMACAPEVMALETKYLDALGQLADITLDGERLVITTAVGDLAFAQQG